MWQWLRHDQGHVDFPQNYAWLAAVGVEVGGMEEGRGGRVGSFYITKMRSWLTLSPCLLLKMTDLCYPFVTCFTCPCNPFVTCFTCPCNPFVTCFTYPCNPFVTCLTMALWPLCHLFDNAPVIPLSFVWQCPCDPPLSLVWQCPCDPPLSLVWQCPCDPPLSLVWQCPCDPFVTCLTMPLWPPFVTCLTMPLLPFCHMLIKIVKRHFFAKNVPAAHCLFPFW